MEELSRAEFARLSATERNSYLKELLGENDSDSSRPSDSDDEDWIPTTLARRQISNQEDNSDHDEPEDSGDTGEIAEGNLELEEEVENSDSEGDDDDVEIAEPQGGARETTESFIAKDKTLWSKTPVTQHQTAAYNVVRQRSGPHRSTEMLSISETFKKIFTYEMVDIIVRHTNKKAEATYGHYNADHPDSQLQWKSVTIPEIYSFFGILICAGANNSNTDHTLDMWHSNSYPLYRATMGLKRFHNILRFLRFDDGNTRSQRKKEDKAAPIRDIWTMMNSNLAEMYKPTANLTIDEQLYPYRGRTGFTQYIPSKPAKYGIKIWWICDAENAYPLQGILYTGKTDNIREKNQGERVVKELATPYRGSGRNICMDNFFTTLPVAKYLLSLNITIVGTIKKNKPYIPSVMGANKTREQYSTIFAFHEKVTMCSYVPKKNKAVILLSTMHLDASVGDDAKQKPEIINFYNRYKAGVDTMDQMVRRYTSQRRSSRWPIAMFFNMLDISSLASYVIFYENNKMIAKKTTERRHFLRKLSEELALPMIEHRTANPQVMRHFSTKIAVESILGHALAETTDINPGPVVPKDKTGRKKVTGSCHMCNALPIKRRRKTRKSCANCQRPVCDEHSINIVQCVACKI